MKAPGGRGAPVRVGGIDYLNALPLTAYLTPEGDPPLEISNHVPSILGARLRSGALDVALVPVVEYLAREEYRVIRGMAIASYGEVKSIRLYHRRELRDVRTVMLDSSSMTSALLTRLLFREAWGASPAFIEAAPAEIESILAASGPSPEEDGHEGDALLLIGDAALGSFAREGWEAVDLGTEWTRRTGLPFVYAFWVWQGGPAPAGLGARFRSARELGIARIDDIVRGIEPPAGLDAAACRHYLHRVIQYDLGPIQIEGLLEFYRRAEAAGLVSARKLELLEDEP